MYLSIGEYLYNEKKPVKEVIVEEKFNPHLPIVKIVNQARPNRGPTTPIGREMFQPKTEAVSSPEWNTADPKIWGPIFWNTLHISASHYPLEASPLVRERMKNRILALPYEIPCQTCRSHAISFIEGNSDSLDKIVSGRHTLGKFYVDFHNQVNIRYNKPTWTYEQAYKKYSGIKP